MFTKDLACLLLRMHPVSLESMEDLERSLNSA
jgi:hypothetical protein